MIFRRPPVDCDYYEPSMELCAFGNSQIFITMCWRATFLEISFLIIEAGACWSFHSLPVYATWCTIIKVRLVYKYLPLVFFYFHWKRRFLRITWLFKNSRWKRRCRKVLAWWTIYKHNRLSFLEYLHICLLIIMFQQ